MPAEAVQVETEVAEAEEEKEAELLKLAAGTKIEGGDSGCDSASIGDDADVSGATSDASSSHQIEIASRSKRLQKRKVI